MAVIDKRIDEDHENPLIVGARSGDTQRIKRLLDDGSDLNSRGGWVGTPLHAATEAGQTDAARLLLDAGADLEARRRGGCTPLHAAAQGGHAATVALLIDRGADVNASDINDRTALHLAAEAGHLAVAERLIAAGADVNARDDTEAHLTGGLTPLHVATAHGHAELAARLVAAGADRRDEWLGAFAGRIYELLRHGVDSPGRGETIPWAEIPEAEKLERIARESRSVSSLGASSVPGAYLLNTIEAMVDYDRLPTAQRELLEDLRAKLDAGKLDGPQATRACPHVVFRDTRETPLLRRGERGNAMPDEPREHPAADKAMRWLGGNWFVPIVTALTLEAIARAPAPHCPVASAPEKPAIEQPGPPDMDRER
jgi:Ankyrin repeats (3 copies)/Ankyrin repeats (many copies)